MLFKEARLHHLLLIPSIEVFFVICLLNEKRASQQVAELLLNLTYLAFSEKIAQGGQTIEQHRFTSVASFSLACAYLSTFALLPLGACGTNPKIFKRNSRDGRGQILTGSVLSDLIID